MSRGTYAIRRARQEYRCTETGYHIIHPGDLYLCAECPPEHEANGGRKWWIIKACLKCADKFGLHTNETRKQLEVKDDQPQYRSEARVPFLAEVPRTRKNYRVMDR